MKIKLTQFSKASGCGCKIAPAVLEEILKGCKTTDVFNNLLVGNESKDDAAIFELDNENCIISTTDFFTPLVDDAFDFGQIAATNAISDVYAMGGNPLMAIAILGWPTEKLPPELAQQVIKGAQHICKLAGIPLAGGHSVDTQEPLFGLAVTGLVKKQHIKKNNTVNPNDVLFLTKPLGIGILSTALKRGLLTDEDYTTLLKETTTLNSIGKKLGELNFVTAVTDVTGFGFIGHLLEMLANTNCSATITKQTVPILDPAKTFGSQFVFPDNTTRNYNDQIPHVDGLTDLDFIYYCDPQTSGGLLFSVNENHVAEMEVLLNANNQFYAKIGTVTNPSGKAITFV